MSLKRIALVVLSTSFAIGSFAAPAIRRAHAFESCSCEYCRTSGNVDCWDTKCPTCFWQYITD